MCYSCTSLRACSLSPYGVRLSPRQSLPAACRCIQLFHFYCVCSTNATLSNTYWCYTKVVLHTTMLLCSTSLFKQLITTQVQRVCECVSQFSLLYGVHLFGIAYTAKSVRVSLVDGRSLGKVVLDDGRISGEGPA